MLKLTSHFDEPPVEGVAMGTYVTLNGYLSHLPANEQRDEFFSCISLIFWPLYQIQSLCFHCRTIRHTICLLNTTIPIPTMLDVCKDSGGIFFLMTKVPGQFFSADGVTLHSMTDEQVFVFSEILCGWFAQLRALPPPSDGRVSGFMGTSFHYARVDLFGHIDPFDSMDAFHEQFFYTLPSTSDAAMQSLATQT